MSERLRVNTRELITLLGKHLYTTPDVIFREMVQNSYDSIRERYGTRTNKMGRIWIKTHSSPMAVEFTDNGMGMDRTDLVEYLSTIGQGLKKLHESLRNKNTAPIGEFGIGFYSSFMISEQTTVVTRKVGSPTKLVWTSDGIDEFDIVESRPEDDTYGTSVTLRLQRGSSKYGDEAVARDIVKRYCNFLDCPIFVNEERHPLNKGMFPWEIKDRSGQAQWMCEHLGSTPTNFSIGTAQAGTVTFGYALSYSAFVHKRHEIYSRRMFVTDDLIFIEGYLDLLNVMINCDKLSLNMSRQQVLQNRTFHVVTEEIQNLILKWLRKLLSSGRPDSQLVRMIKERQEQFQTLALSDPLMFERIYPYLLFRVANSEETVTIEEYIKRAPSIAPKVLCMSKSSDQIGAGDKECLILMVCEKKGIPVLMTGPEGQEDELLRRICNKLGLIKTQVGECTEFLLGEGSETTEKMEVVRRNCERFLGKKTRVGRFEPPSLPLVIDGDEIVLNEQNTYLATLGAMRIPFDRVRPVYLSLYKVFHDLDKLELAQGMLTRLLETQLDVLENWQSDLSQAEKSQQKLTLLSDHWWSGPRAISDVDADRPSFQRKGREYIFRCFIACPFKDAYQDVVTIVTDVCASFGVLAETAVGIDTRDLLEKVCLRIDGADFAVVDVSEVNPNVMLELGILIARRKPAIIIRDKNIEDWAGIRVPADIVGIERIEYSNKTEDLRRKLHSILSEMGVLNRATKP